ncbi:MAG: hypothetical protein HGA51_07715 [Demequinaceae bacterium]|nr:hypothetical protein [Demequinaceae bacterium]
MITSPGYTWDVVAMVVYESLWGNTAAIAHAVADGLGPGTRVGSTGDISPEVAATADLLVVGAPVHAMSLPTARSLASVASRTIGADEIAADVDHPLIRDWVAALPYSEGPAAAFDTRITGLIGRGGARSIERLLKGRGRRLATQSGGFVITNRREVLAQASMLRDGELERALEWGALLADLVDASSSLTE